MSANLLNFLPEELVVVGNSDLAGSLESRSPSPWPSPLGRGEAFGRLLGVRASLGSSSLLLTSRKGPTEKPSAAICNDNGGQLSLSPRERAGVRGKEPFANTELKVRKSRTFFLSKEVARVANSELADCVESRLPSPWPSPLGRGEAF